MPDSPSPAGLVSAVIVAAGSSRRMGFDKLMAPVAGCPLVAHTLAAFMRSGAVSEIILVVPPGRENEFSALFEGAWPKPLRVVAGGQERHLSVWNGLLAVTPGAAFIAVHDAARPVVSGDLIDRCLAAARIYGAAAAAEPMGDTLQRADGEGFIAEPVDRTGLWRLQTPQIFSAPLLVAAYCRLIESGESATDETTVIAREGGKVFLLENREMNPKATYPRDLALIEFLLGEAAPQPPV